VSAAVFYVLAFALALLVNGALLALAQPILLKGLMPHLGASAVAGETGTGMFLGISVVGYTYAHACVHLLGPRRQGYAAVPVLVLSLPLLWWGFGPGAPWISGGARAEGHLEISVTLSPLVLATTGVPLLALTAAAPLLLRWFAATPHPAADDPYFLFPCWALGGLAGWLAYPFLVEPYHSVAVQSQWWLAGVGLAGVGTAGCAVLLWWSRSFFPVDAARPVETVAEPAPVRPAPEALWPPVVSAVLRRLHWIALSAVPVALALTVTTYVSVEVSAIPLFGFGALVVAQLTLILAFAQQPLFTRLPWRARWGLHLAHGLAILVCLVGLVLSRAPTPGSPPGPLTAGLWVILVALVLVIPQAAAVIVQPLGALLVVFGVLSGLWPVSQPLVHLLVVFVTLRCCHGELARNRPPPEGLTGYFLSMAVGGAVGGVFVVVLAPRLFPDGSAEYWVALVAACCLRPGSVRNGLTDSFLARGLCALRRCGPEAARLIRFVMALVLDWLYPLLLGMLTVQLWLGREEVQTMFASLGIEGATVSDSVVRGLPLLLCLVVVARRVRFGLSLGAVLLAQGLVVRNQDAADLTFLPGIPDAQSALALLLLPAFVGAVVVLTSLFSVLVTEDNRAHG
jgi:hypothetical protein